MNQVCSHCNKKYVHTAEFFPVEKYSGKLGRTCRFCLNKKKREYYEKNKDKVKANMKKHYEKNKEVYLEKAKEHRQANKEVHYARAKNWKKKNPEKTTIAQNEANHVRRARNVNAPGSFTEVEFKVKYRLYKGTCAYCGKKIPFSKIARDHVIPLSKGGSNFIHNIVPACQSCNLRKHAQLGWTPRIPN